MKSHDRILEDIASFALGALPRDEATTVAAHVRTCRACSSEYRDAMQAVSAVAYSAQACATGENGPRVSPLLKERVMAAIRDSAR